MTFAAIALFFIGCIYSAASIISGMMMDDVDASRKRIRRGATVGFWIFIILIVVMYLAGP